VTAALGRGGIAIVYLAHDQRFDRQVALKVLPASLLLETALGERFDREARILERLKH
jgi:serine/threonine protein kinase